MRTSVFLISVALAFGGVAGPLDKVWLCGTTDREALSYRPGDEMTLTLTPMDVAGEIPAGAYFLDWKRTDDLGGVETGRVAFTGAPFVYKGKLTAPGFLRLEAYVVDADGKRYFKKFQDSDLTPEGQKAMNMFERQTHYIFFDGGAGFAPEELAPKPEPADFDAFWKRQFERLDLVPVKAEKIELKSPTEGVRLYAVRIDCAGLHPATGYLSVPKCTEEGRKLPCGLVTHGYSDSRFTQVPFHAFSTDEIVFNMNAHGLKLPAFGGTEADAKAHRSSSKSNGRNYAFDPIENADPETAYFNGMVLRVKRALQYLKTLEGWNGKDLIATGGSQGGLQTIWAAACGEGVTKATPNVPWCCDIAMNDRRLKGEISGDGWFIPWTEALGYYDAVNFAKRIPLTCRTFITRAGLGDYCCPPMGLAKLYNAIPGNKMIRWAQGSQHGYVPPEYEGRDVVFKEER